MGQIYKHKGKLDLIQQNLTLINSQIAISSNIVRSDCPCSGHEVSAQPLSNTYVPLRYFYSVLCFHFACPAK